MPASALTLALAAALVHAIWNLLLAREEDTQATTAVALVIGAVAWAPAAVLTWDVDGSAIPYIAVSAALELVYIAMLASAYSRAEISFVYPVARGSAPVLVLAVSALALGADVSAASVAGVVAVGAGVMLVRGLKATGSRADLALALAIGASIASYTLVDNEGIEHAAPLPYLELVFALTAAGYLSAMLLQRDAAQLRAAARRPATVVAGVGFFGSYALALAALEVAPAAAVAAVRETSVLIATVFAAVWLREEVTRERAAGALLVVGGVGAIALG